MSMIQEDMTMEPMLKAMRSPGVACSRKVLVLTGEALNGVTWRRNLYIPISESRYWKGVLHGLLLLSAPPLNRILCNNR